MTRKSAIIYYAGFLHFGGVLSHVRALENELLRNKWNVTIITLDKLPLWCKYLPHFVEKVVNFFNRPLGYYYKDRTTRLLYKLYFQKRTDLCVFEDIYISWNSAAPSITVLHAVWSDNLQSKPVAKRYFNKLLGREAQLINKIKHPVVTVSKPYLDYLFENHFSGLLTKKIGVVELGVDQSKFSNQIIHNKKAILFVGVLEARKNILFLLKVFNSIMRIDSDYKLTIVGDGPDMKLLTEYAKINKLKVYFLGALSHDSVVSEMHNHGIYVHTSIKESFSYSLLEAKLAGLRTFAYSKLQVPLEFIDVPIDSFDVDEWCTHILNYEFTPIRFNSDKYTVANMTSRTLDFAN
jgi:glycosyltransferase involved in cell wall biosynthesis